jgi:hypothetical protein
MILPEILKGGHRCKEVDAPVKNQFVSYIKDKQNDGYSAQDHLGFTWTLRLRLIFGRGSVSIFPFYIFPHSLSARFLIQLSRVEFFYFYGPSASTFPSPCESLLLKFRFKFFI